jgi:hypothetical protein
MDYLLRAKEQIEWALFEQLRNLFSICFDAHWN